MAVGLSVALADALNNALARNVSFALSAQWIQLHVGDPGAAGTANVATNNTRKDLTSAFGTASSGASIANTVAATWASVPAAETYTHFSIWSASTSGTFRYSGVLTADPVALGDPFVLDVGDMVVSWPVAS